MVTESEGDKYFQMGAHLALVEKEELISFLKSNVDLFAWNTYMASGIDKKFMCHHLNVNLSVALRRQPRRLSLKEHVKAVKEEVVKLKQAGAIMEVFYPEWLANTVVVKKKNRKWHICVDFTNLNKAFPKDPFPVPRIDQLVDAMVGHPRMSFLGAFQGYHKISLALLDQEKTAFRASTGNFHYRVMPFGLKNAGSTFQRMMTRMFESQIGQIVEAYIDDMVNPNQDNSPRN